MPSLTLAISAPVGRDTSDLAVTKKSHVFQISNRGRISGWQNGQIRSAYSRLIMGVSSSTKPRLPGLFFLGQERAHQAWALRGRRRYHASAAETTTPATAANATVRRCLPA